MSATDSGHNPAVLGFESCTGLPVQWVVCFSLFLCPTPTCIQALSLKTKTFLSIITVNIVIILFRAGNEKFYHRMQTMTTVSSLMLLIIILFDTVTPFLIYLKKWISNIEQTYYSIQLWCNHCGKDKKKTENKKKTEIQI